MAIARPPPVPAVMPRWRDKERRHMKRHAEWRIATAFWRRSRAAGRGPGARHRQAAVVGVRIAHRVRQSAGGWNVSAFGRWTVTGTAGRSTPPRARARCGSVAEVPRIRARTRRGAAVARAWPRGCSHHGCLDSQDGDFARVPAASSRVSPSNGSFRQRGDRHVRPLEPASSAANLAIDMPVGTRSNASLTLQRRESQNGRLVKHEESRYVRSLDRRS